MRRSVLLILSLIAIMAALQSVLLAQSSGTEVMTVANDLYEAGRYSEAADAYERLVDQGLESSDLFYNLGNAYFKSGDLGRAILNYRRADRLDPRDQDIQANLDQARDQTVDQLGAAGDALVVRFVRFAKSWVTLNEMAVAALVLWALLLGSLTAYMYMKPKGVRRLAKFASVGGLALLVVCLFLLGGMWYADGERSDAVVVEESVDVLSGPGTQYVTVFTLHAGAEASVIETRAGWARLGLPGGELQGWVPAAAVQRVGL